MLFPLRLLMHSGPFSLLLRPLHRLLPLCRLETLPALFTERLRSSRPNRPPGRVAGLAAAPTAPPVLQGLRNQSLLRAFRPHGLAVDETSVILLTLSLQHY